MSGIVIAVLIIAAIAVVVGLVYALYDGADVTVPERKDVLDFIRNVPLAILVLAIVGGVIYGVVCLVDLFGPGVIVVLSVVPLIIWCVREGDLEALVGILGIILKVTCGITLFIALISWSWDVDTLVMIFCITFFIISVDVSVLCFAVASIQMGINQKYAGYSAPSGLDDDFDEMIRERDELLTEVRDLLPERWTAMPNHERFLQRCVSLTSADGAVTNARICMDTRKEHFLISIAKDGEPADIHSIECSGVRFKRHAGSHWFRTNDQYFISQLFNEENPTCTLTIKTDDGTTYETTFNNPLFREQPKELDAAAPEPSLPTPDAE